MNGERYYALLIIDMINDLEFSSGNEMFPHVIHVAQNIYRLKKRLSAMGIPTIYVNDNYGKWQSDFRSIIEHFIEHDVRGKPVVELLRPNKDDYFILKPTYSGFFATPLQLLLSHLNIDTLILTGMSGNMCVQFTANDAYMRNYDLIVPSDCIVSKTERANEEALRQMHDILKANTAPSSQLFK